jgi:hypothetical protein
MTTNQILFAIGAGLIAAVVFASATSGPMLVRIILFFLTPLSLYLVGLGVTPSAGIVAAATATLAILFLTNPVAALIFAVSAGAPAAYTTRLALLGRQENGDAVEWYPTGRILLVAALFAGLFAALAMTLMGSDMEALTKAMRGLVDSFVKSEMSQVPGGQPLTDQQVDEITARIIGLMPMTLAALSLITTLLNLWLAGRITLASGRLVRPWPDLGKLALPSAATFILLASMLIAFAKGIPGLVAGGFGGAMLLAFAVVGLSVAHDLTRETAWRGFLLTALYAAVAFLTPAAVLILAVTGIADTIFKYRDARASRTSGPPN